MIRPMRLSSIGILVVVAVACNLSRTGSARPIDPVLAQTYIAGTETAEFTAPSISPEPHAGETKTASPSNTPTSTFTVTATTSPTASRTLTATATRTSTATITLTSTKTPSPFSLQKVTGIMSIDPGTISVARARCPGQSVVIGGGFTTRPQMVVLSNFINENTWFAHALNTFNENEDLTVYAYCLDNKFGATNQIEAVITIPKFGSGHVAAACPAGALMTGGGFEVEGEDLEVVTASYPSVQGWQTRALNLYDYKNKLNAYAICLSPVRGRTAIVFARFSVPAGNTGGGKAVCPANSTAISGGFDMEADLYIYRSDQSSNTEWEAYAIDRGIQNRTITVYAICQTGS